MTTKPNDGPLIALEQTEYYFENALWGQINEISKNVEDGFVGQPIPWAENILKLNQALSVARDLVQKERQSHRGVAVLQEREKEALIKEAAEAVAQTKDQFPPQRPFGTRADPDT